MVDELPYALLRLIYTLQTRPLYPVQLYSQLSSGWRERERERERDYRKRKKGREEIKSTLWLFVLSVVGMVRCFFWSAFPESAIGN